MTQHSRDSMEHALTIADNPKGYSRQEVDQAARELKGEVERLRLAMAEGNFKEVYAEGLELGKRFGAPALGRLDARIRKLPEDALLSVREIRSTLRGQGAAR